MKIIEREYSDNISSTKNLILQLQITNYTMYSINLRMYVNETSMNLGIDLWKCEGDANNTLKSYNKTHNNTTVLMQSR